MKLRRYLPKEMTQSQIKHVLSEEYKLLQAPQTSRPLNEQHLQEGKFGPYMKG